MIIVTTTCTKTPGTNCPLIQYNDDGTPRCAGCINARLNFDEIKEVKEWEKSQLPMVAK